MRYQQGQSEEPEEGKEDIESINNNHGRVWRGGSFGNPASFVRSAYRLLDVPTFRVTVVGIRPARTFAP